MDTERYRWPYFRTRAICSNNLVYAESSPKPLMGYERLFFSK